MKGANIKCHVQGPTGVWLPIPADANGVAQVTDPPPEKKGK